MFKYILVPATGAESDAPVFATAVAVARLFAAVEKSVKVIQGDATAPHPMHRRAA